MASFVVPSGITGEQLMRFAQGLEGVAASQPTGRVLDGTVTISDQTSNGQPILRVAVTGRIVGAQQLAADKNPTYDF
jgi:hypothetical protein